MPGLPTSPETGAEPEAYEPRSGPIEIELEVSRQRAGSWAVFGLVVGALLIWKLGTVGVWVGVILMIVGAFHAWELVQTFLHKPGTIVVREDKVILPRGLCMGKPLEVTPADVTAVYFLRRSVPWNRSAPVLVIELGTRAMAFPRDWFASEADQRHVVHALVRNTDGAVGASTSAKVGDDRGAAVQMAGGAVLVIAGVVGALLSHARLTDDGGQYALYVAPIVIGAIVFWRGLSRF